MKKNFSISYGVLAAVLLGASSAANAQTSVFSEDFESGSGTTLTGWTFENGSQTNNWAVGSATANGGSNSAYISNDAGTSNNYTRGTASVVHLYCDVVLNPAIADYYKLSFSWKGYAEVGFDELKVFLVETSTTPTAGTELSATPLGTYSDEISWQQVSILIPPSATSKRLVFSWINDDGSGAQPPIAIDDIDISTVAAIEKTVNVTTPGTLKDEADMALVKSLIVTGNIDARDVKFMRDGMGLLTKLDLSGATIDTYTGSDGPGFSGTYPANGMPEYSFYPNGGTSKTSLTSVQLPVNLTSIGQYAFYGCSGLTGTLVLPAGLTSIGTSAFQNCYGFTSILNLNPTPISINNYIFSANKNSCTLIVPSGSVGLYQGATVWNGFKNIIGWDDAGAYKVYSSPNIYSMGTVSASVASSTITLTATSVSGNDFLNWTSKGVVLSTANPLNLTVTQDTTIVANFGNAATVNLTTAGTLKANLTNAATITRLTVTGNIDARDVQFMRDSMTVLAELDLSSATVIAYSGEGGTATSGGSSSYLANEMPREAFDTKMSLVSVQLPAGLTAIRDKAFTYCTGLRGTLVLPVGLTSIGANAFSNCESLGGLLTLPVGLTTIGSSAFYDSDGFSGIINLNPTPVSISGMDLTVDRDICSLTVPSSSVELYKNADEWKDFANIIGGGYVFSATSSNVQKGSVSSNTTTGMYPTGTSVTVTATAETGYEFLKWTNSQGDSIYNVIPWTFAIAQDSALTAQFAAIKYDITYHADGGAGATDGTYTIESTAITLPATPEKTGYTFDGWYDNAGLTGTAVTTIPTNSTGNKEFWAKWTATSYTITYHADGGAGATDGTYTIESTAITLPATLTKTGYTFAGWYDNAGLTGTAVTTIPTNSTGNKEFWAKWTAISYTITYHADGGTGATDDTYTIASAAITLPATPEKTGYTFGGWYDNVGLTGTAITTIPTNSTGNKEFWAKWTTAGGNTVETVAPDKLQIYPNPTADVVNIINATGAEVKVYNHIGILQHRTNESRIDLSAYPNGIYLLKIGRQTLKVVKK